MSNPVIEVKDQKNNLYRVGRASAVNQMKLLQKISPYIVSNISGQTEESINDLNSVVGMLMMMPENLFDDIVKLCAKNITPDGEDNSVTIDYFNENITSYFFVVASIIKETLSDFFLWLTEEVKKDNQKQNK